MASPLRRGSLARTGRADGISEPGNDTALGRVLRAR